MVECNDVSFNIFEAGEELVSPCFPPLAPINVQTRRPFRGQYDFHLDFKNADLAKDYRLYTGPKGKRIVFVNRDKPFVIRTLFQLPLTPANLYLRVIPLFTSHSRRNDVVLRCPNHTYRSAAKSSGTPVPSPAESSYYTDASRNIVCIQAPNAQHCFLDGHLTVLLQLDRRQMAMGLRPPSPCSSSSSRRYRNSYGKSGDSLPHSMINSTQVHLQNSQSPPSGCTSSYPMGVAMEDLVCRIGCYNSCFGGQPKGGIELIVRLEELLEDPRLPPIVHGLDSVEIRCSSTPARDIRNYTVSVEGAQGNKSSRNRPHQRQSTSDAIDSSDSRLVEYQRPERRGLSMPAIVVSDTTSSNATNRRKRRLALAQENMSLCCSGKNPVAERSENGAEEDFAGLSQSSASSPSSSLQRQQQGSAVVGSSGNPAFVELPGTRGEKKRYYLVVTKSKERAARFRFEDDASQGFDGSRMSSSRFATYRAECLRVQNDIAQFYASSAENCQPPK